MPAPRPPLDRMAGWMPREISLQIGGDRRKPRGDVCHLFA